MSLQNKNILVLGGAGFIGSTLVRELLKEHANITVYDNFISGKLETLEEIEKEITILTKDIRDPNLKKLLREYDINYIFNLAAHPFIPECYEKPREFFDVDASGVMNLLMAIKDLDNVQAVLHYSTSEVYGTARLIPMDENHPLFPHSTYAASKLAADRICFSMYHEHKLPVIILRQFNTYGPRETHPYVIPELITQLSKSRAIKLGNIKARRDFTYVTDAVKGAILLIKNPKFIGEVFNLGYGDDLSVEDLANIIGELLGHRSIEITLDKHRLRPFDVERLQANYFKLHQLTGWEPSTKLKEGLQKTIDWYNKNNQKWLWDK